MPRGNDLLLAHPLPLQKLEINHASTDISYRQVSLSFSPSGVTRKKAARKKKWPREILKAASRRVFRFPLPSLPYLTVGQGESLGTRLIFSREFLSRHARARRTKRKPYHFHSMRNYANFHR